mgnify:FL=1
MNITEAKMSSKRTVTLETNLRGYNPYKSEAESEYDKKKEEQHKKVHQEIARASLQQSLV